MRAVMRVLTPRCSSCEQFKVRDHGRWRGLAVRRSIYWPAHIACVHSHPRCHTFGAHSIWTVFGQRAGPHETSKYAARNRPECPAKARRSGRETNRARNLKNMCAKLEGNVIETKRICARSSEDMCTKLERHARET